MSVIYKYAMKAETDQLIVMPKGAAVLHVMDQNGRPHLWASVDPTQPPVQRRFRIYRTGEEMDGLFPHYVGTYHLREPFHLVFHVFTDRVEYPKD